MTENEALPGAPRTEAGRHLMNRLERSGSWTLHDILAIEAEALPGASPATAVLREALNIVRKRGMANLPHRTTCSKFGFGLGGGSRSGYPCTCGRDDDQRTLDAALRAAPQPASEPHEHSMWECGRMKHVDSAHWMDEPCTLADTDPFRCKFEPYRNTRPDLRPQPASEPLPREPETRA